ncbi:sodium:solute symporter [bacterium]|jgi:solute:Na+ symporter, SSS family|nr:sodium:solute symporter [bacterium]MDB4745883.1 sodium:solute symporter [Verrucomicrobiota bacterium]
MTESLRLVDLIVLVVYLGGIFGLGCWLSRRSRGTDQFMAAGRSLSGWVVGLSIFGTYMSSIGFLGNPGKSFSGNWNPWVFGLSLPLAAWVAARYFIPVYRSGSEVSAYFHLEQRFGPWARNYALVCYLLTQLARMGTILYLVALALAPLTGWSVTTIIFLTGLMVTIYTLLGGIEAVIWTDVIQSIVLTLGAVLCAGLLLFGMPEGPGQLFEIAREHNKFSLGSFGLSLSEPTFWMILIYGFFINLQNFGIDQSFVQRYITAKSDRDARFSVWVGALLFPPIAAILFFIGTGLFAFYTAQPELLPASVNAGEKPDAVFPHFIVTQLPLGVTGLLIASIFAAAMSSVDTSLNSSATLFLRDIYQRYIRPNAGERESMRVLHVTTLVWGLAGTVTALAMIRVKSALDAWWNLSGIFSGGMLGIFLLGLISVKAKNPAAIIATLIGILSIVWLSLAKPGIWPESLSAMHSPFHPFMTIILGTTIIVLLGGALGMLFHPKSKNR